VLNGDRPQNGDAAREGSPYALDMTDGRDRKRLRGAISRGWKVDHAKLERYAKALDHALALAMRAGDARQIRGCVNTLKTIVDQIQKDEHREEPERHEHSVRVEYVNRWEPNRVS
jgi:hypothetical protein